MTSMTLSKSIDAPPAEVFKAASDFRGAPGVITSIKRVEVLGEGEIGLGTRFRETRICMKREATEEMEITAWEPGRAFALECESCGAHYRTDFRFAPEGRSTRVDVEVTIRPISALARLFSILTPLMKGPFKKAMEKDLDDLKAAVEGRSAAATPVVAAR